jgi:hypothetical protein
MPVQIKLRRDSAANWLSVNPVLSSGEPGLETDTRKVKYGNGVDPWSSLNYAVTQADAGSLTGATLAPNVLSSSLTSVGVLTGLTVTTNINGSITGNAGSVTNGFYTNSSFALGTSTVAVNRVSGLQSLTGINIDGNSGTATKLATARNINGVAFDGTAAITVTADASTLTATGGVLNSAVTSSSLTSVGTLISVSSSGAISTSNATNTNNNNAAAGSITTAGGVGITKDLYVGGNTYIAGNLIVTGTIQDSGETVTGNLSVSGKETVGGINTKSFSIAMAAAMA